MTGTALATTNNQVIKIYEEPQLSMVSLLSDPNTISCIKNTVAKGASDAQLAYFITLAKKKNLNPFNKEIYFMGGNILPMIGVIGMRTLASRRPDFKGLKSSVVRENDEFEWDSIESKPIKHVSKITGKVIGAWAVAYREGFPDCGMYVVFSEFTKNNEVWNKYSQDMILAKVEKRVLEKQFPDEYRDFTCVETPEVIEPLSFAEQYSPAPAALTMADYLGDDKPVSTEVEPLDFIDQGQKANFCIKQKELLVSDVAVKRMLQEKGFSPSGSRSEIYKSKFLQAKKALEELAKEVNQSDKQTSMLDNDPYKEYAEHETGVPGQQGLGVEVTGDPLAD